MVKDLRYACLVTLAVVSQLLGGAIPPVRHIPASICPPDHHHVSHIQAPDASGGCTPGNTMSQIARYSSASDRDESGSCQRSSICSSASPATTGGVSLSEQVRETMWLSQAA